MTTGMPELGSKISLISKADIRYEGRLFTVDPQECTIALASVRSFGTEDRETQYPVPAQNQVYDYILFRGSDIKDIRVVNNVQHPQPLNDPAIMQLSVPPQLGGQPFGGHPALGLGPPIGSFGGAYGMGAMAAAVAPAAGPLRGMGGAASKPSELIITPEGVVPQRILDPAAVEASRQNDHASVLDLIGGGSRSTTPASLGSRKSPTNDQGVQAGGGGGHRRDERKGAPRPIQPPRAAGQQRRKSGERRDSKGEGQNQGRGPNNRNHQPSYNQGGHGQNQYQGGRNQNQDTHNQHQGGHNQHQGGHNQAGQNQHQGGYHQQGGYQQGSGNRGNWVNRGPARPRGRPRGGFRPGQGQQQGGKPRNTLKFENDYDFEQANTEFEELRSQLAKVKIDETGSASTNKSEANGVATVVDTDKKDDSGNETGAGETEQEEEHEVFYDKSKSFFDKISCEAVERAKGKSQRTDWRVERKLNSETFGVAATRRGAYRGRGPYRGMGYRGGYRGNYRQPQQRREQQHHNSQSQQQQQAAKNKEHENASSALTT